MFLKIRNIIFVAFFLGFHYSYFSQTQFQIGHKLYLDGKVEQAIDAFNVAIDNNEDVANSYMYRGASKNILGKYFEAINDIKVSINLDSTNHRAYFYYGRIYFNQGFFSTAIKYYNIAISKNKSDADIYDDRAVAKAYQGDYVSAIADEDTAIQLNSSNPSYFLNRGYIKLSYKDYSGAISDFDKTLKIGDNPKAYSNKGIALAALGQHNDAIKNFTIAIEKMPKAKDIPYHRGMSYLAIDKFDLACSDFRKSEELGYQQATSQMKKYCNFK